ncbi:hypothetical protein AUK04_01775 [Candidatus Roizmanbacteria bacterium CG2_30_33_16]|uniref:EamA domain-containing protein n=6 Tax=Candidatus Roizmaniibacteriota TaxID=1752723 RepID=A0A2M8DB89_9BACT|nr:MAG: hypothetical protein AUK04_01775 [Candidatus Roizmanbacteria bacterium CG2_30_33_16]PJB87642.1 MAG: hypothetical protein CO083_05965 [Candidatus Roizmanbacteria bacterium CG_4_9_14_0_8_um_filter_34_12]
MNPILALIIANFIWGAASPVFKFALENIPPFTLAFIRFFGASLLFIPFIKWRELTKITQGDWVRIIIGSAFLGVFVNIFFFFLGLQRTVSINAPVIASSSPILLFILSIIFLKEKPKLNVLLGMIIAFFGVLLIILMPLLSSGINAKDLGKFEGNLFFLIATIGSTISPIIMKKTLNKVSLLLVTFIAFFISSLGFLILMLPEQKTWNINMLNLNGVIGIIFGVFFSSALAYYLYIYGLSKIKVQEVGIFTYIDPVIAVIIAIPLLGEYPNIEFIIGTLLIFLGIFIGENRIHYHPFHRIAKYLR